MVGTPLTLAALATSAVPDLIVEAYSAGEPREDYRSAVLDTSSGRLLVRVPSSERAEVQVSSEILSLTAFTDGLRAELPFEIPRILGITRAGDSRAVVSSLLEGTPLDPEDLTPDDPIIESVATALAAVHDLPASVIQDQGLPTRQAAEVRADCSRLVARAQATRVLPETVREHWERMLTSTDLWDFQSTVIHGSLSADLVYLRDSRVAGIAGWADTAIGDPASDFAWLFGLPEGVFTRTVQYYRTVRPGVFGADFIERATFWHQLELAKWLIHGIELRDADIVEDAVSLLDKLVGYLAVQPSRESAASPIDSAEVEKLLDETPQNVDRLSETAVYDALDEDREFISDPDFADDSSAESDDESRKL